MPSIGPSFFILGVVMVTTIAAQTQTAITLFTTMGDSNYSITNTESDSTSELPSSAPTSDSTASTGSTMSISNTSTITTWTLQKGNESSTVSTPTRPSTTPKPISTSQSTTSAIKTIDNRKDKKKPNGQANDNTGIIILVVIVIVAIGFGVACYLARRRGRRYSVDFPSRQDEANIPLSAIDPELPVDGAPQNGLQTFESTETNAKEPQEPEAKPLVQEEHKAEADKSVVDPSAESAAPALSANSSGDKPKEDVFEKSPAPVEPNVDEKTDDEGIVSNKTSVESLKETNKNNSNNADVTQKEDWKLTDIFWEVSLDSPV